MSDLKRLKTVVLKAKILQINCKHRFAAHGLFFALRSSRARKLGKEKDLPARSLDVKNMINTQVGVVNDILSP